MGAQTYQQYAFKKPSLNKYVKCWYDDDSASNDFWRIQSTSTIRVKMGGNVATCTVDSSTPGTSSGVLQDETINITVSSRKKPYGLATG